LEEEKKSKQSIKKSNNTRVRGISATTILLELEQELDNELTLQKFQSEKGPKVDNEIIMALERNRSSFDEIITKKEEDQEIMDIDSPSRITEKHMQNLSLVEDNTHLIPKLEEPTEEDLRIHLEEKRQKLLQDNDKTKGIITNILKEEDRSVGQVSIKEKLKFFALRGGLYLVFIDFLFLVCIQV